VKQKLDHKTIENLTIKDKPYKVHDAQTKGMFVLVHNNGSKYFRINYTFNSKQKTLGLGVFPTISLVDARLKAATIRSQIANNTDPSKLRKKAKNKDTKKNKRTFKKIALDWIDVKSNGWKPDYCKDVLKSLELNVFPYIGDMPIDKIKSKKLTKVFKRIEKRGSLEMLKKVRQRCNGIFIYAKVKELVKSNPCEGQELLVKYHESDNNFPSIELKELPALIKSIETTSMELTTKSGLLIALYTFLRTSEIRFAKWSEINFDDKIWLIPAVRMKKRRDHIIPLSAQVIKVFKELHPITGHYPFVFASRNKPDSKPFSENAMLFALYRMGYRGKHSVHGFRHLAMTILNELGFDRRHIKKQMSHVIKSQTEKRYNRAEYLHERTILMQEYADFVDKSDGSNIVPIGLKPNNFKK
jgi:integrase